MLGHSTLQEALNKLRAAYYSPEGFEALPFDPVAKEKALEHGVIMLSMDETDARNSLILLCKQITEEYGKAS